MLRNLITLICVVAVLQVDPIHGRNRTPPNSPKGNTQGGIESQIVGGTVTVRGQIPYAAVIITNPGNVLYGGALIHGQWVLTSGSCANSSTNFVVKLGVLVYNLIFEDGRVTLETNVKVIHPQYNSSIPIYDLALIKLPLILSPSAFIKVVRLPKKSEATATFLNVLSTASGWGVANSTLILSPNQRSVDTLVTSNAACAAGWGSVRINSSPIICTNTTGFKQTCSGDQGGPLTYKEIDTNVTLIGITSYFKSPCASGTAGVPAVFTKVSGFLTWIGATATGIIIRP